MIVQTYARRPEKKREKNVNLTVFRLHFKKKVQFDNPINQRFIKNKDGQRD